MRRPGLRHWLLPAASLALFAPPLAAVEEGARGVEAQVDELFAERHRSDAPGGVVAVIRDGRVVHQTAFGMADLERGVAVTAHSVFEIGSISKQFTAMCILLLEHDGELSLDDDVREHIAELRDYGEPITIRHLLHHTSGIRDVETLIPLAGMPWVNYYEPDELLELITRQSELNFAPGSDHLYSNSGYLLLAEIVGRVSGRSLRQFAQERIFGPLGMKHTVFWERPSQIVVDRAMAYSADGEGGWRHDLWNLPFAGPAGVYTTVGDLALWDANFYDNKLGGGADLIARMETPGTLDSGESTDYAAGLVVGEYRGHRTLSHGGAWMGYRAGLQRFPDLRLTIAALSNAGRGLGTRRVADLYLPAAADDGGEAPEATFEPPEALEVAPEKLAVHEGVYWNESDGLLRRIEVRDGELHYVRGADNATPLGALGEGHFVMIGPSVRVDVEFAAGGTAGERTMTVSVEGDEPLLFEPVEPTDEEALADFAGDYWSRDLGRGLELRAVDGRVVVSWEDEEDPAPAESIGPDEILLQRFVPVPWYRQDVRLRLERDESGAVSGLRLTCDMVRRVGFDKRSAATRAAAR